LEQLVQGLRLIHTSINVSLVAVENAGDNRQNSTCLLGIATIHRTDVMSLAVKDSSSLGNVDGIFTEENGVINASVNDF
jgi:hypothetical protein